MSAPARRTMSGCRNIRPTIAAPAGASSGCRIRPSYPVHQYYYVDQGPTYDGPGEFAPYPTYHQSALGYHHPVIYTYRGHHWRPSGYRYYGHHHGYRMHRRYY